MVVVTGGNARDTDKAGCSAVMMMMGDKSCVLHVDLRIQKTIYRGAVVRIWGLQFLLPCCAFCAPAIALAFCPPPQTTIC